MNCVLITGATGVIGSELAPLFLNSGDSRLRLIIRAGSAGELRARLAELTAYWGQRPDDPIIAERVEALAGDVCRPRLGLDEDTYDRLCGEVTHIVHCAGNVKLNQPLEAARASAMQSADAVVAMAKACQRRGGFQKLDALSTVGVAGRMPGLIPERPLTEPREFHNTYEQAKAEAEEFLLQQLDEGLPLTIHRPSMVVGHSQTGRVIRFQVFYYLCEFLSGRKTHGLVVDTGDARLDIIPVDYVAQAIHIASRQPDTVGRIFHLCSGPERTVLLSDLSARCRESGEAEECRSPRLLRFQPRSFRRLLWILTRLSRGPTRRALSSLPHFLAYLDEFQQFDVARTARYFSTLSLPIPGPLDYTQRLLTFYHQEDRRGVVTSR